MGVVWRACQSSVLAERARKIDLMITLRVVFVLYAQLRTDEPPWLGGYRRRGSTIGMCSLDVRGQGSRILLSQLDESVENEDSL
jgi:hypothetical protein